MTSVEDGTTLASCCLSFLAKQSSSLCSFLCCSLCATPVWIALLQLGCSLASCSHFMCLILHCFRLCLRIPLKHFHCSATLWLRLPFIGQFTVLDLLWEHGQRNADKVTSPMKLLLDNRGLNNCDICLFQNTTVCLFVLPLDVEDTVKTTLMIPFMIFEMAAIGCPSF